MAARTQGKNVQARTTEQKKMNGQRLIFNILAIVVILTWIITLLVK